MLKIFSQEYLHDETGVRYVIVVSWVRIHQGDSVKYNIGIFHGGSSIFVKRLSCLAHFSSTSVLLVVKLCKRNIGIHIRLWSIQPSHLNLEVEQKCKCYLQMRTFIHVDWLLTCLFVKPKLSNLIWQYCSSTGNLAKNSKSKPWDHAFIWALKKDLKTVIVS